ncbi:MAG: MBL fold metallo-hydrolase [Candidatus Omnitrophota bacterium]
MIIHKLVVGELRTNCYIVVSENNNAFIIDPGDNAAGIQAFCQQKGVVPQFIVNTHGHIDHIKANDALKLPVYVHEDDVEMVSSPVKNMMTSFFGTFTPVVPERRLKDGDSIELDGMIFHVIHTPGHTRGCICLSADKILFSGDTLFRDGVGRTDFPGASSEDLDVSLKKLSLLDKDTVVYPGHGGQTTIGCELF